MVNDSILSNCKVNNNIAVWINGNISSIDAYISSVNKFPILSHDEEISLGRQLRDENDISAAHKIVMSHLRLVVSVSRGYLGYGLSHADLIQEGNIGLMKAVKRFDPEKGVRLVSYALHWIKAEIHEFILRNWRVVKLATTKVQRKLFFNLRSNKSTLDSLSPDQIETIAKYLDVKSSDVIEMEKRISGKDLSFDHHSDNDEDNYSPENYLISEIEEPENALELKQINSLKSKGLTTALSTLDNRSRRIVEARWLNKKMEKGETLQNLAKEFGVSPERIRQIESSALKKMKKTLSNYL